MVIQLAHNHSVSNGSDNQQPTFSEFSCWIWANNIQKLPTQLNTPNRFVPELVWVSPNASDVQRLGPCVPAFNQMFLVVCVIIKWMLIAQCNDYGKMVPEYCHPQLWILTDWFNQKLKFSHHLLTPLQMEGMEKCHSWRNTSGASQQNCVAAFKKLKEIGEKRKKKQAENGSLQLVQLNQSYWKSQDP